MQTIPTFDLIARCVPITICLNCSLESHAPLSCDEFRDDPIGSARRRVEQARLDASFRVCAGCKVKFTKAKNGDRYTTCNEIKCRDCLHSQCYLCSEPIRSGVPHFTNVPGACPMYGGEERIDREIIAAEDRMIKQLLRTVPGLNESDLRI